MKVVTWNINGIRTFKNGIKKALDSLDADIICVQETKVTRDLLDERTAIVDGYSSYFSFCRGRSGYSGVATFCKENVTPIAAEEGLTGFLTNHDGAVGCYGDQNEFSSEELQLLDSEGRAVITQHKVMCGNDVKTVTLLNVYCPRADPDKPERKLFKLQFYKLLQDRAEAILRTGSYVIVLGDVNTSHEPIDHCDPGEIEHFEENPSRKWLNSFLSGRCKEPERDDVEEATPASWSPGDGGKFVDMFRSFHPTRTNAFTCWSTRTGARQTNYGTRIDYIFADCKLAETHFLEADIMPEVEGSDHCPVRGRLCCTVLPSPRCPPLCTRHMPEFAGRQQKLSQFLVKVNQPTLIGSADALPGSQESGEVRENLIPFESENRSTKRKGSVPESSASKGKRSKVTKVKTTPQGSLLAFFKAKSVRVFQPSSNHYGIGEESREQRPSQSLIATPDRLSPCAVEPVDVKGGKEPEGEGEGEGEGEVSCCSDAVGDAKDGSPANGQLSLLEQDEDSRCPRSGGSLDFWRAVLRGPPQPPKCKVHEEPCVLRTVKKAGPNMGRQFFVCARPQGHTSNPQARCNFFAWVDKGK